ncbi:unnamed protein product [Ilex paraguariensis]|uniref:Rhodanese domain-containing protein n=1 Tax=Ilex paraguariensis TaxID=185542 RepID=A0ABC8T4H7_9AQUA
MGSSDARQKTGRRKDEEDNGYHLTFHLVWTRNMRGWAVVFGGPTLAPYTPTTNRSAKVLRNRSRYRASLPLPFSGCQVKPHGLFTWQCKKTLNCALSSSEPSWVDVDESRDFGDDEFIVVNFYRFVFIKNPEEEVSKHLAFLQDRDIHGRIYLNEQGINAQYSGPSKDAFAYVKWLKEDHRFSGILFQVSVASKGHAFPRLKLRYKPSLVQLEGGISHLPLLDPSMRATPLTPSQWRNRLESVNKLDNASDLTTKSVLLDVRNGYEWDVGHFRGAQRPDVGCFRSTSFGLSKSEVIASDPLAGVDKERTDILMYCTGGIRCDVYSAILR